MRIITLNVNGLRAAERKGFARWLARAEPWDVVCLQEIKCLACDVPRSLAAPRKSHAAFHPAARKGLQRCRALREVAAAIRERVRPRGIRSRRTLSSGGFRRRVGHQPLSAVRIERSASAGIEVPFPGRVPAASRDAGREAGAKSCCAVTGTSRTSRSTSSNWRANQKNSGFLPEERAWLTQVFDELGFVDVFRRVEPRPEQYTWWSNRGQAWAEERRLAHRLPDRHARHRGEGARRVDLQGPALFGSCAADHRLRLRAAVVVLRISSLTLSRGTKRLLEGAELTVHARHKVGLVGANGCGKSSLFAAIRGELSPDAGAIELPPRWTLAHVAQETPAVAAAAIDYVMDGDRELREVEDALAEADGTARGCTARGTAPSVRGDRRLRRPGARGDAACRPRFSRGGASAARRRVFRVDGGCGSTSRRR